MRVLVVTNDYPPRPGGIQQWLGNLVDALDAEVRVLAPKDGPAANARGEGVVVRGERRWMLPTRSVRRWIEHHIVDFDADVVLYAAPHPLAFLGPKIRVVTGVPYAVMTHGAEITLPAAIPGLKQLLARPLRSADVLFSVSDYTGQRVARLAGRTVHTVGAGVDLSRFTPDTDRSGGGPVVIGCVSRFVPRKGQKRILEAARKLVDGGLDVRVDLVGKGRNEAALRRSAEKLGVETGFHVDVPWADLPGLYRQFDIFAMPCRSRWFGLEVEGLGIVFLEAAAVGLPVVAGDSGGAPETVIEGATGDVVRSDRELAQALERLARAPEERAVMGAAGRRMVEANWTWEKVAERVASGLLGIVRDE
jgi:phosphatidylinositol alpha-1,6-mannosyltransferase